MTLSDGAGLDDAKHAARLALCELVTPARWDAFVDWMEACEGRGDCDHDDGCYEPWFTQVGDPEPLSRSKHTYDAMRALAGGPCACAAGADI
jgi:hypothetical protein